MEKAKTIAMAAGAAVVVAGYLLWHNRRAASDGIDTDAAPVAISQPAACMPKAEKMAERVSAPRSYETATQQTEEAHRAKERGNKRFVGRQYDLAIKEYTQAIDLSPAEGDAEVAKYYGNRAQVHPAPPGPRGSGPAACYPPLHTRRPSPASPDVTPSPFRLIACAAVPRLHGAAREGRSRLQLGTADRPGLR